MKILFATLILGISLSVSFGAEPVDLGPNRADEAKSKTFSILV